MSKQTQIQKNNPGNTEAHTLAEMFDQNHDIKAVADMEGGKQIVELLKRDVVSTVNQLVSQRRELSLQDFQSLASDIDAKLGVIRLITRAEENETLLNEQIAEALAE